MTLDNAKRGEKIAIVGIEDKNVRVQAIRLGISEGSSLYCVEKLPAGPIILKSRMQEVAVGRKLAQQIIIEKVEA